MKNYFISNCLKFIQNNKQVTKEHLEVIEYGLVGIYLMITKLLIVLIIAFLTGYFFDTIIFFLSYGVLRSLSYGLHAKKSWICLITSILMFNVIPIIAKNVEINIIIKVILGIICILLMYKNSPADTYKRPLVNKRKRIRLKYLSSLVCIIYYGISIYLNNNFISNYLLFSMILQNIFISPITYRLFKLPYNNYINYLKKHPELNNL